MSHVPPLVVDNRVVVPLDASTPPASGPVPATGVGVTVPARVDSLEAPKTDDSCPSCPSCAVIWKQVKAGFQAAGEALERFFVAVYKFFRRHFGLETPQERLADHLKDPASKDDSEKLQQALGFFKRLPEAQQKKIAVAAFRADLDESLDAMDLVVNGRNPAAESADEDAALLLVEARPELLFRNEVNALLLPPANSGASAK